MYQTIQANHLDSEQRFVFVATELQRAFPDLELHFNHLDGTTTARCIIPELSDEILEIPLESEELSLTLHEAIFAIKVLAQLFDD